MRYYDLRIYDAATGRVWSVAADGSFTLGNAQTSFTSLLPNGNFNPGALNVELDVPVIPFDTPQGKGSVRVWGVPLRALGQAANLNGATFSLKGGMSAGLPLAKPQQAGLIVKGQVFQAFGNWQGVNQTLDLVLYPGAAAEQLDLSFHWRAGTPLSVALAATFTQAFPGFSQSIAISPNLILPNDESGHYTTFPQFAKYIKRITLAFGQRAFGASYRGVSMTIAGTTIKAFDGLGTSRSIVKALAFEDIIGQPTWINPTTVNFKTVMRADIAVGSEISFPTGIVSPYALTTAAAAYPNAPARSKTVFQGKFEVVEVHHFGNFRQADADSWVTTFNAVAQESLTAYKIRNYIAGSGVALLSGVA